MRDLVIGVDALAFDRQGRGARERPAEQAGARHFEPDAEDWRRALGACRRRMARAGSHRHGPRIAFSQQTRGRGAEEHTPFNAASARLFHSSSSHCINFRADPVTAYPLCQRRSSQTRHRPSGVRRCPQSRSHREPARLAPADWSGPSAASRHSERLRFMHAHHSPARRHPPKRLSRPL